MIVAGWSNPTQTPQVIELVKPTNQASLKSFVVPVLPAAGSLKPNERELAAVPLVRTSSINSVVIRVVDPLDDVALLANPGIGENREGRREIFQVRLERADVDRGSVRNVLPK